MTSSAQIFLKVILFEEKLFSLPSSADDTLKIQSDDAWGE
jgi:hypothetical protein